MTKSILRACVAAVIACAATVSMGTPTASAHNPAHQTLYSYFDPVGADCAAYGGHAKAIDGRPYAKTTIGPPDFGGCFGKQARIYYPLVQVRDSGMQYSVTTADVFGAYVADVTQSDHRICTAFTYCSGYFVLTT
jgi:hypothetical protein